MHRAIYRWRAITRANPVGDGSRPFAFMNRTSAMGLRDYAMFLLIATYGLRASEVVAISTSTIFAGEISKRDG